ncbi:helix-turn-helix transcriptional regulator [Pelovirga terrestris]|uniref:HTH luxR-type domain-containing protein n=1 Tax=Pelovirga terrestris TaxID=2771352 RepID=A0A8J6QLB0_9BACT|nr:LuxR C-terminal-related transcriptional regulator [Pelovirga terrestris]MBD1400414.1 hypothetical protein [Pelovirga terrestris]
MSKLSPLLPTLSFAAFVFWLLAVPMNGPLIAGIGIDDSMRWFLLPHVLALVTIGTSFSRQLFTRLAPIATVLTPAFCLLLPLVPELGKLLLVLLSFSGAFVALGACKRLHCSPSPLVSAGGGLILANLALFVVFRLPAAGLPLFALATLPLFLLLVPTGEQHPVPVDNSLKLSHYLPFILIFHVVSGLMYSVIYPAYQQLDVPGGVELPFYMVAVIAAVFLGRINREIPLILGVVLGMGAFIVLQWEHAAAVTLSLFIMQAGQGFIDLFLLAFLLRFSDPLRAFGIGLATLCLGIYGGQILGDLLSGSAGTVAMFGHLFLNLAVLSLYLLHRRHPTAETEIPPDRPTAIDPLEAAPNSTDEIYIPDHLRLLLSERELLVLTQSLKGTTYKEIASELDIAESTVKTYMKRICDKCGVTGKRNLLQQLTQPGNPPSASG